MDLGTGGFVFFVGKHRAGCVTLAIGMGHAPSGFGPLADRLIIEFEALPVALS